MTITGPEMWTSDRTFHVERSSSEWPSIQSVIDYIRASQNMAGYSAVIQLASDHPIHDGFLLSGLLPGQVHPANLIIQGDPANINACWIRPQTNGHAAAAINWGGSCIIRGLTMDMRYSEQDWIIAGKRAQIILGQVRFRGGNNPWNCITLTEGCSLTVAGNLHVMTDAQCLLSAAQYSTAYWNTNGVPNLLAVFHEQIPDANWPHYVHSFLRASSSDINIQNVDYHGTATGYRVQVVGGGRLNLNTLPISSLPGSQDTAWPIEGWVD